MKKILLVLVLISFQSTLTFCQTNQKGSSIKMPEFKQSSQIFPEKGDKWETAAADIDNDGDLDLIISHLQLETAIYLNDGKGLFIKSSQNFQSALHGLACGDLDNDGDIDLVFTSLNRNQPSPVYYINNGRGTFELHKFPPTIETDIIVDLIDIDNDGDLDVYINRSGSLFLNDGKGNFNKSSLPLPVVTSFYDLNKDGAVDILSALPGSGFKVYLNDKKGNFTEFSFLPKSDLIFCYTDFADIDNDGDIDVIFSNGNYTGKYPSGILLNDGAGKLTDSGQKLSTVEYGRVGMGDLNNDGFTDIVIAARKNPAKVWMNNGKGIFIDAGITLGEGGGWTNCLIKDLDNDGDMDVFITRNKVGNHGLWLNQLMENKKK